MKGISAKVSIALNQRPFPLAISQAIGMPAIRSKAATIKAIMKLFWMATKAWLTNAGLLRINWRLSHLMNMPAIGGSKISPKKIIMAEAYTAYLMAVREESLSSVSLIFSVKASSAQDFYALPFLWRLFVIRLSVFFLSF